MTAEEDKLPFMHTEEAAAYLGINKLILCKFARQGKIPAFKFCNKWFFDKEKLIEFFNKNITAGDKL